MSSNLEKIPIVLLIIFSLKFQNSFCLFFNVEILDHFGPVFPISSILDNACILILIFQKTYHASFSCNDTFLI